jgi:hypothetical protein
MKQLKDTGGSTTFTGAASDFSETIRLGQIGYFQFTALGDASTGTLTLQQYVGGDWRTFAPGGTAQTFTNTTLSGATATHTETYIVGGCDLRFGLATAGSLQIFVQGDNYKLV